MGDTAPCAHAGLYWYASPANEQGWKCVDCNWQPGEPAGFSPQYDRSHLHTKVSCIVHDLHDAEIIYVSNGSDGDALTAATTDRCRERGLYDSVSIARVVLEIEADDKHTAFWRDISEGIIAGRDPRDRCACGQLSRITTWRDRQRVVACSQEHLQVALGRDPKEPF